MVDQERVMAMIEEYLEELREREGWPTWAPEYLERVRLLAARLGG
jgi:hypothetical protein